MSLVISLVFGVAVGCLVAEEEPTVPEPEVGADSHAPDEPGGGPSFAARTVDRVDQIREDTKDCCPARDDRPAPEVDPSLDGDERTERARKLFQAGLEAFERGAFVEAAESFEASYAHAPDRHVLSYNIGKAWQGAGDCCRTRRAMLRYLELGPNDAAIALAQKIVDELECSPCP